MPSLQKIFLKKIDISHIQSTECSKFEFPVSWVYEADKDYGKMLVKINIFSFRLQIVST